MPSAQTIFGLLIAAATGSAVLAHDGTLGSLHRFNHFWATHFIDRLPHLRRLAASLAFLTMGSMAHAQTSLAGSEAALAQVKTTPGSVVAMRHTEVMGTQPTHYDPTGQCRGESMLTAKGRAQAKAIGTLFASQGVVPYVIHSPMCRTTHTAQLAFPNSPRHTDPDLREIASADAAQRQAFLNAAMRLLRQAPRDRLVVFIGHGPNLFALTMENFGYGTGLIGRITPEGEIEGSAQIKLYENP